MAEVNPSDKPETAPIPETSPPGIAGGSALNTLIEKIKESFNKWDQQALKKQESVFRFVKFNAILVPAAVLFLTVQILAFSDYNYRAFAIFLIALELAVLITALYILFADIGPTSQEWARDRLRAEALRREECLLITRVGPYLTDHTAADLDKTIKLRLTVIDNDIIDPEGLFRMQDQEKRFWRDMLEDTDPKQSASPDLDSLKEYHAKRVTDQQNYFFKKSSFHAQNDSFYEHVVRGVLTGALVVAAMHLVALITCPPGKHALFQLIIEILAIVLPPIGVAASALQSFFQYRRLSHSYRFNATALTDLTLAFHQFEQKINGTGLSFDLADRMKLEFKRLVLKTEELLGNELLQWYFVMRPDKPPIH